MKKTASMISSGGVLAVLLAALPAQAGRIAGGREHHEYGIYADTWLFEAAAGKEISAAIRLLLTRARQAMAAD